jgi:hypothetical protein
MASRLDARKIERGHFGSHKRPRRPPDTPLGLCPAGRGVSSAGNENEDKSWIWDKVPVGGGGEIVCSLCSCKLVNINLEFSIKKKKKKEIRKVYWKKIFKLKDHIILRENYSYLEESHFVFWAIEDTIIIQSKGKC